MRTTSRKPLPRIAAAAAAAASALLAAGALALGACGSGSDSKSSGTTGRGASEASDTTGGTSSGPVTLRLGYFANVTHAPALVGIEGGGIADALGSNVTLETSLFNAGGEAVEAIFSGALDASFIGPSPSINAYAQSDGKAVRVVSGVASGGAFLVVKPEIASASDLAGKKIATPQLGNTQDVALRAWLKTQGFATDTSGGGDVEIVPQENAQTLDTFKAGDIDGAWVPEPWATRLVNEGGGKILVDERDLWPAGKYVTTVLLVSTDFLEQHPDVVKNLIIGTVDAIDLVNNDPEQAKTLTGQAILRATTKEIAPELLDAAFENITFTADPIASSLVKNAEDAADLGLIDPVDVAGIFDLDLLNEVLGDRGLNKVSAT